MPRLCAAILLAGIAAAALRRRPMVGPLTVLRMNDAEFALWLAKSPSKALH